jgi:hypothetical protein
MDEKIIKNGSISIRVGKYCDWKDKKDLWYINIKDANIFNLNESKGFKTIEEITKYINIEFQKIAQSLRKQEWQVI